MEIANLIERFDSYHGEVKKLSDKVGEFQNSIDRVELELKRPKIGEFRKDNKAAAFAALAKFARTGDDSEYRTFQNSALIIGDDTLGGYTVVPEVSDQINVKLFDSAPMLGLCRKIEVGATGSWIEPIDTSDAEASWVSETEARPETNLGSFGLNTIPLDEQTALVKITQRLLDDSKFDLASYIIDKIAGRFGRLLDAAIVAGDGVKKPKGFLSYATSAASDYNSRAAQTYQYVPSGNASVLTADAIVNLFFSLRAVYRQNCSWVMSSDTARQIRLLRDADGNSIWAPALALASPDTLCGKPVVYDENMPAVGAGTIPIAVGDWQRAVTIITRPGIRWLRDPYSAKPFVLFFAINRVGGQSSMDFDALKLLKVGTA